MPSLRREQARLQVRNLGRPDAHRAYGFRVFLTDWQNCRERWFISKMRLGEGAAGTGFQILFKRERAGFVRKGDIGLDAPGPVLGGVPHFTRVVL
jgi:hypothetical protein